jgi:DeoR family glycerol-3-phosphate regulon repressor
MSRPDPVLSYEVRVGRAIIENSREVFIVADHTKFGREAMVRLCNIQGVDALFTGQRPQPSMSKMLSEADVTLHVANEESDVD